MQKISPFLFLILILLSACKSHKNISTSNTESKESELETKEQIEAPVPVIDLDTMAITLFIKEYIQGIQDDSVLQVGHAQLKVYPALINFYGKYEYQPAWLDSVNINAAIETIKEAKYQGLKANDYNLENILVLRNQKSLNSRDESMRLAWLDVLLTHSIYHYASHLIYGKLNPVDLDPFWNYSKKRLPDNPDALLRNVILSRSIEEWMNDHEPEFTQYLMLKSNLSKAFDMKAAGVLPEKVEYPGMTLRKGDTSAVVIELKNRLRNHGAVLVEPVTNLFDDDLEYAVKAFQKERGLEADGLVGKKTYEWLNVSLQEYIDIIRLNMERLRWLNDDLPSDFILVNIADFQLYVFKGDTLHYRNKVVVGKEFTQTPIFQSAIRYIEFNPTL